MVEEMRLSPCRFNLPLTDNDGQPIPAKVIIELQRELLKEFGGFTIHSTSEGRWKSSEGRVYREAVVIYEVAVSQDKIPLLRGLVVRLGRRLGQKAMYFDAPPPSVDILDTLSPPGANQGQADEARQSKKARGRGKKNRPSG